MLSYSDGRKGSKQTDEILATDKSCDEQSSGHKNNHVVERKHSVNSSSKDTMLLRSGEGKDYRVSAASLAIVTDRKSSHELYKVADDFRKSLRTPIL